MNKSNIRLELDMNISNFPVTETSVTLGAMIVELSSWMIVEALMAGEDTTTEIDMIHTEEETLMMMTTIKSILVEVKCIFGERL